MAFNDCLHLTLFTFWISQSGLAGLATVSATVRISWQTSFSSSNKDFKVVFQLSIRDILDRFELDYLMGFWLRDKQGLLLFQVQAEGVVGKMVAIGNSGRAENTNHKTLCRTSNLTTYTNDIKLWVIIAFPAH